MMSDGRTQSLDCKVKKKKTFKQDEDLFFNRKDTLTFSQNSELRTQNSELSFFMAIILLLDIRHIYFITGVAREKDI
ncbi:hypothetical protein CKY06_03000 [Photorhabdus sp. S15-56]|nr:hypothetical protein CKY15_03480 [Photorhabdus sp. S7-51]RAW76159.1 hypothetical protein CKY14_02165 [Photorhabdus sp. S14-60]RAW79764.1 hypothetical protein CKY06_03000 [Photorhabdus sp. S15-56]